MPNERGSVDLTLDNLSDDEKAQLAKMAKENGTEPGEAPKKDVLTGFQVAIGLDGQIALDNSLGTEYRPQREPAMDDIIGALSVVLNNMNASQQAAMTVQMMQASARQMQEQMQGQMQAEAVRQKLQSEGHRV